MEPRFFVDDRAGCVAVRDRTLTDPEYQGLHEDTEGVVKFWMKDLQKHRCTSCGHTQSRWIDRNEVNEARELAKLLNKEDQISNNYQI